LPGAGILQDIPGPLQAICGLLLWYARDQSQALSRHWLINSDQYYERCSATLKECKVEVRVSKKIATSDDAAANQEEVDEQMGEDAVKKKARENATGTPAPIMKGADVLETADNVVASSEEVTEQAQESRIDKVAFEDGISTAAAEEYIGRGRTHD
jgi:hypothetical protein